MGTKSSIFLILITITTNYYCQLYNNHPNPFNPSTTIKYELPDESKVKLVIYNILGEEVAILNDKIQTAGYHHVKWDASNLTSGIYIYRLTAESINNDNK